jgi:PKD repeat protein
VVFNSISSGGNIFSWNFGDGSTGTGATVTHNYNTSGIYTIDLTTTAVNGCSATRAKQNFITVRSSPVPSITTGTQNICLDDCVSFQGVSTGSPVSWTWNLPGARPSTAFGSSTGSVCYSQLGNYAATLTVNDGYCTGTTTLNNIVRVNNCYVAPIADFIVSDSAICSGECLSFVSMSLNATGWRWNFPGATPITSTLEQPTGICYSSPGSYPVVLIASNPTGADTITYSNLISVSSPPPPPSFSQTGNTLSAPPGYQYQWYFNNIAISGANNVNYTATLSGNYAVEIIDANGCTAISSIQHISLVGVNDLEGIASLNIYPNPTSDFLIIETICLSQKQLNISLVDGLGRALLDKEVSLLIGQNSIKLDISQFAVGTYFIHVDGIGSMIKKIVKF